MNISAAELEAGRKNWALMPEDMRAFFTALIEAGLTDGRPAHPHDGRRALANARVAVYPARLPTGDGVQPCIPTREEREAIEAIRKKGKRA